MTKETAQKRRRSKAVPITVAALLGSGLLAGCGSQNYDQVCVDKNNNRLSDAQCNNGTVGGVGHWYYIPRGKGYAPPAVGKQVIGGSPLAPTSGKAYSGSPASGGEGTVSRGGFGGKSGTVGG
jgi:hypothetical protein